MKIIIRIISAIILGFLFPSMVFGLIAFCMWDISFLKIEEFGKLFRILFVITFILSLVGMSQEE